MNDSIFAATVAPLLKGSAVDFVGIGQGAEHWTEHLAATSINIWRKRILDGLSGLASRKQRISLLVVTEAAWFGQDKSALQTALRKELVDIVCLDLHANYELEARGLLEACGYAEFRSLPLDPSRVGLIYSSPALIDRNPCYGLARELLAARAEAECSARELKLVQERQDLIVSALRKERALYQKQLWRTSKRIKGHLSYRLGAAIVTGSDSVRGTLALPKTLLSAYRAFKQERASLLADGGAQTKQLSLLTKEHGYHGLVAHIERMTSEEKQALDEASFGHYIVALSNAFQFEKCIAEFEKRYPASVLKRPRPFEYPVIRAYTRSLLRHGRADDAEVLLTELVRRYPHQADYSSLLGYVLAGHKPTLARNSLRTAIMLGSRNAHTDAILLYRTLMLERLPLKEAWGDVVSVLDQMSQHKFAMEAMDFLQSTMKLQQGRTKEALRSLNSALARNRMAPVALWRPDRPFGIDNFTVPLCEPGSYRGPLVSVLMTTHNSEEFLDTAMRSVLEQTYADLELIVVDDCSTDGTREKLAAWAEYDKRVVVLHNKHNVGTYGSKNLGLLKARGKFITCHDSDDWSHPQKIAFQVMRLRKTKAMACYSRWVRIDERGFFEAKRWGQVAHSNPSSLLYHRSVIDTIGFYDTVRTGADTEFHHRIVNRFGAASVFETPSTMAFGRSHSDSLTRSSLLGFDEYGASPYRQAYWMAWGEWHLRAMKEAPESLYIDFPPQDSRQFDIPQQIAVSAQAARLNVEAMR